jgi:cyclophilin family peptidyl-prolyl cis-trans isomerase
MIQKELEKRGLYKFTEEQKKAYTTVGGAPHLDSGYTVYGEVIEGLDVVDKIAAVEKNQFDRPKQDIKMRMKIIK